MISLVLGGCRGLGDPPGFWGRGATEILSPLLEPWAFPSVVLPFVSSGPGARQVSEVPVPSVSPKLGLLELNGLGFPGMCGREAEPCLGLGCAPARSSEGLELSGMQSSSCSFPSPWSSVWSQPLSPGAGNAQDMETIPASRDIPCLGLFSSPFLPKPHPCCSCAPLAPQGMAVISRTPLFYQFRCWQVAVMNIWLLLGWILLFSSFIPLLVSRELSLSSVPEI